MQRRYRLRRDSDFKRLRREGRAYRHPTMVLSLAPNGLTHNRYGFIVTKHLGNAVTRNRVRRLLREAVRCLHPRLAAGYDIVVVSRPEILQKPLALIAETLETLCRRAGVVEEDRS